MNQTSPEQVTTADISFVIPVFNEEGSLRLLYEEVCAVCETNNYQFEIVFINDGSTDDSWNILKGIADQDSRVIALRFRRNFGKAAAIRAGVAAANREMVITMDADLQDDPAEVPNLIAGIESGTYDVVSGWKKIRHDPIGKRWPSKFFNMMVGWLTGLKLHDHNCGFKAYRRHIFDEINLYGELHRFIPVLAAARGFRVGEVVVNHRAREFGKSKYGLTRLPKGFLDLLTVCFLTSFNHRPQHMLGSVGLGSFAIGITGMAWMAVYWLLRMTMFPEWTPLHQRPIVLYSLAALLLGAQLLCIGFLAELITARNQRFEEPYSIGEVYGQKTDSNLKKTSDADREAGANPL